MHKKSIIGMFTSTSLIPLLLATTLSTSSVKAAVGLVTRTSGVDRYDTAAKVAVYNWDNSSKNVVLVNGKGYADAVSGSVLAKTLNAPILLTQSKILNEDTKDALNTLKPTNIYILGGIASISQSIRDELKNKKYNLIELIGKNRYETNAAVANELVKNHGVSANNVLVVGGEGFSDAISAAPIAAAKGQILLLGSNNQNDMKPVINFVNTNKSKAIVIGTSNVINDSILKDLNVDPSTRIDGGVDRFATNLKILKAFSSDLKNTNIYIANATADDGYADALVASVLAAKTATPLVLVDTETSLATTNAIDYIKHEADRSTSIHVIGGKNVVPDSIIDEIWYI